MGPPIDLPEWLSRLGFADDEYVQAGEKLPGGAFRAAVGPISALKAVPQDRDMWVGPSPVEMVTQGRPSNDQVTRLAALHIDLDVKAGGCSSFEQAHAIVDELAGMLGTRPVAVTFSGHGVQPVWAIEDGHIYGGTPGVDYDASWFSRPAARALMRRWGRLVAAVAERHGAHVDALWDLTRILRCPGSVNHKDPASPVPVLSFADTGAPLTVERILETLDEWGVTELPEDAQGVGDVVAPPSEWTYAVQTCGYAATMIRQWATDQPAERHRWLIQNAPRIAAAVRYGCFDQAGHQIAVAALTERFAALLGDTRKPTPGEVSGALSYGQEIAACMSDSHLASELGFHLHAEPLVAPPTERSTDDRGALEAPPGEHLSSHVDGDAADRPATIQDASGRLVSPADCDELPTHGVDQITQPTAWDLQVEQEALKLRLRDEARRVENERKAGGITVPAPTRLDVFLSVPDEDVTFRIHGLMPTDARVMLAAQFKAGKTTTVGNLVRSLVDSSPFLGHFDVESPEGAVVVIDDEMSEQQLRRWLRDQDIARTDRVSVVSLRGRVGSFDILNEAVRSRWAAALSTVGCGLLVFDCLRPVLDALGLSEDKEAGRFLVAFDALLTEAGIAEAVVVHHMGHGGERSRGDSRIRDWPDVEWRLIRDVKPGEEDPAAPRFFSAFGRDVSISEGLVEMDESNRHLKFDPATNRKDHRKAAADASGPDPYRLIAGYLSANQGALGKAIVEHLQAAGIGDNKARAALRDMTERGGAVNVRVVGRAHLHYYEPVPDPADDGHQPPSSASRWPISRHHLSSDDGPLKGGHHHQMSLGAQNDPFGTGLTA